MRPKLDWQTDEDGKPAQLEPEAGTPPSGKRAVRLLVALTVATVLTILLATLVNRRQADVLAQVERNVVLAFNLQQEAVLKDDEELFSLTLSPSDRAWRSYQERLFEEGFFAEQVGGVNAPGEELLVTLSPDLKTAEITYERSQSTGASATSIALQHTAVFRLEGERWLQSAPDPSFWGHWQTVAGDRVTVAFPERDAQLARRLAADIDAAVVAMCTDVAAGGSSGQGFCSNQTPIRLRLANESEALFSSEALPSIRGNEFDLQLPAPTLLGIPASDDDYEAYARIYMRPLLQKLETALSSVVAYPEQAVYALCYDHPLRGQHLYRYSRPLNTWEPLLPQQAFQDMSVSPDDSSIILANASAVTILDVGNLEAAEGGPQAWQRRLTSEAEQGLVGWMKTRGTPYLLMQAAADAGELPRYSVLDLAGCTETSCSVFEVPGFPSPQWSGDAALFLVGTDIYFGSQEGIGTRFVGKGFSPFWLDQDRFGFVRFAGEGESMTTELVVGDPDSDHLALLLDGNDLARAAGIPQENVLFINQVIFEPGTPGLLLLSATGIRDFAGRYFIFTADIDESQRSGLPPNLRFQLERKATPGGVPGQLTPTGKGRFLLSSDGRWLAMTELHGYESESWSIILQDLQKGGNLELSDTVPAMPGNFPLLDWSADGRWLLVADRGFLRLISPQDDYQESIAHSFDACTTVAWAG